MNKFKFGDFCKAVGGTVLRVIHVDGSSIIAVDKVGMVLHRYVSSLTPLPEYVDFDGPPKPRYFKDEGLKKQVFVAEGDKYYWLLPDGKTEASSFTLVDMDDECVECTREEAEVFLNPPKYYTCSTWIDGTKYLKKTGNRVECCPRSGTRYWDKIDDACVSKGKYTEITEHEALALLEPKVRYFAANHSTAKTPVVFKAIEGGQCEWLHSSGRSEYSRFKYDYPVGRGWKELAEDEVAAFLVPAKPEPVYAPWTFETMPIGVKVKHKGNTANLRLAAPKTEDTVYIGGQIYPYVFLFENYTQLDGTPCGTIKS